VKIEVDMSPRQVLRMRSIMRLKVAVDRLETAIRNEKGDGGATERAEPPKVAAGVG